MGKYKDALKDCNKSLELNPKNIDTLVLRGLIYKQFGNQTKEKQDMLAANRLLPQAERWTAGKHKSPIEFNYAPGNSSSIRLHGLDQ